MGTNAYSITCQYDPAGNRTQIVKNSVSTSYTYNNNNQLLTETAGGTTTTYAYDGNGNLLTKTAGGNTTTYAWDWNNRLLSVSASGSSTSYAYDGDGTRISKTQNGVKTKYINDVALRLVQVLMETDNAGIIGASYTYGQGLISMNRNGADVYYHYDGLDSARQLTDEDGAVIANYTYDAFGNLIASSGTVSNTYGFTGQQQFAEADGLVFLRARYYKPSIGRFISRDPIGYGDGMNFYAYVENNPVNYIDPSGKGKLGKIYWCTLCAIQMGDACGCSHVCDDACSCGNPDPFACADCHAQGGARDTCIRGCIKKMPLKSCVRCAAATPF